MVRSGRVELVEAGFYVLYGMGGEFDTHEGGDCLGVLGWIGVRDMGDGGWLER